GFPHITPTVCSPFGERKTSELPLSQLSWQMRPEVTGAAAILPGLMGQKIVPDPCRPSASRPSHSKLTRTRHNSQPLTNGLPSRISSLASLTNWLTPRHDVSPRRV